MQQTNYESLVMNGLADVDRFKIFMQVCVWLIFRLHYGAKCPVQPDSSGSAAVDDHLCDTGNFCTEPLQEDTNITEYYRDNRSTTHCWI